MYSDNSSQWAPLNFKDISLSKKEPVTEESSNDLINKDQSHLNTETREKSSQINEALEAQVFTESKEKGYQEGHKIGHEEGHQEGYKIGYEDGYKVGKQEGIEKIYQELEQQVDKERMLAIQSILDLVANFQKAVNDIDTEIVSTLTNLAIVAAQKMVDSLPDTAYQQLSVTIKELIRQFPILGKSVHLYIHPNDMESAQELLSDELTKYDWHLITDPAIEPGGCKIVTEKNEIDATLSSKFQVMTEVINRGNS